jgi:putative ABC transport system substrate-binding protein
MFREIERAIVAANVDVLMTLLGGAESRSRELMEFVQRAAIPTLWEMPGLVRAGGLLSHRGSLAEAQRKAVEIVARILRGENPATIPIHEVTSFDVVLNLRTARAMKLEVPRSVLVQATEIIE